jgi:hypothetical protein
VAKTKVGNMTTSAEDIIQNLSDENPDALLADGFAGALIGVARRCGQPTLAVYDYELGVEILVRQGMSAEEAVEWMEFNVVGGWHGPHTPIWLMRPV